MDLRISDGTGRSWTRSVVREVVVGQWEVMQKVLGSGPSKPSLRKDHVADDEKMPLPGNSG